jgi:hypothetical protein
VHYSQKAHAAHSQPMCNTNTQHTSTRRREPAPPHGLLDCSWQCQCPLHGAHESTRAVPTPRARNRACRILGGHWPDTGSRRLDCADLCVLHRSQQRPKRECSLCVLAHQPPTRAATISCAAPTCSPPPPLPSRTPTLTHEQLLFPATVGQAHAPLLLRVLGAAVAPLGLACMCMSTMVSARVAGLPTANQINASILTGCGIIALVLVQAASLRHTPLNCACAA